MLLKKVLVASVAVVAALALMAASASAEVVVKDPKGNVCPAISGTAGSGSSGTGGCAFSAVSPEMWLTQSECDWVLKGVVNGEGKGLINSFVATPGLSPLCGQMSAKKTPWNVSFLQSESGMVNTIDVGQFNIGATPVCSGQVTGDFFEPNTTKFDKAQMGWSNCFLTGSLSYSGISVKG